MEGDDRGGMRCTKAITVQIVLVSFGCLSYVLVAFNRISPAILAMGKMPHDIGTTRDQFPYFSEMFFWSYAVLQPFIGAIVDLIDPAIALCVAQALTAVGSAITGSSKSFGLASFGRVLVGLGSGGIMVPVTKLCGLLFGARGFVIAQGGILCAGGLGGVIAQLPLEIILERVNWRSTFYATAALEFVVAFMPLACRGIAAEMQRSASFETIGGWKWRLRELWRNTKEVGRDRYFWCLCLWNAFTPGAYYNVGAIAGVRYLEDVFNYSQAKASGIVVCLNVAWIVGTWGFTAISEGCATRKWVLVCSAILSLASSVSFLFLRHANPINDVLVIVLMFVFGLFAIGPVSLCVAMLKEMQRPERAGTALGISNMMPFMTSTLQQHVTGTMSEHATKMHWNCYKRHEWALWIPTVISCGIGLIGAVTSKETYEERRAVPSMVDNLLNKS